VGRIKEDYGGIRLKVLEKGPEWTRRAFWRGALALCLGFPGIAQASGLVKRKYIVQKGDTLSHLALRFKTTVKAIRDANGLRDGLAYHFVIGCGKDSGDGEIEVGSRWTRQIRGGHVRKTSVNDTGIGICLVGNFQNRKPTAKQLAAFHELMRLLEEFILEKKCSFAGHKEIDVNHTVCPGRLFPLSEMHKKYD
jgi:hypothetical protein